MWGLNRHSTPHRIRCLFDTANHRSTAFFGEVRGKTLL